MTPISRLGNVGVVATEVADSVVVGGAVGIAVRSFAMLPTALVAYPVRISHHKSRQAQYPAVDLSFLAAQLWRLRKLARRFLFLCWV